MPTMVASVIQAIPREPGSYLLWLHLPQPQGLSVGKLGFFNFPAGHYIYLGSACGPGGLQARLGRHLRGSGQLHWHIDHLRAAAQVRGFGYAVSATHSSKECDWSQQLAALPDASLPASGFGASDCRSKCAAHLVHFPGDIQQKPARIADQIGIYLRSI
jgi:Uri superfamily endonuclease